MHRIVRREEVQNVIKYSHEKSVFRRLVKLLNGLKSVGLSKLTQNEAFAFLAIRL